MLKGAKILNHDDGMWLSVIASNGLQASLNLHELDGDITKKAFLEWAQLCLL